MSHFAVSAFSVFRPEMGNAVIQPRRWIVGVGGPAESGREGVGLQLLPVPREQHPAVAEHLLPSALNEGVVRQNVEQAGEDARPDYRQRHLQPPVQEVVHRVCRDVAAEYVHTVGDGGEQRHIFGIAAATWHWGCGVCHPLRRRTLEAVKVNECLGFLLGGTVRIEEAFRQGLVPCQQPFQKADCLLVAVLVASTGGIGMPMAIDELLDEHAVAHPTLGDLFVILPVRCQQQLARVAQSRIAWFKPFRKATAVKKKRSASSLCF